MRDTYYDCKTIILNRSCIFETKTSLCWLYLLRLDLIKR